jgi:hypothetical protein
MPACVTDLHGDGFTVRRPWNHRVNGLTAWVVYLLGGVQERNVMGGICRYE